MSRSAVSRWTSVVAATVLTLTVAAGPVSATVAPAAVYTVYVSPTGSDAGDGRTPATAVKTLRRVEAMLTAAKPQTDVEVRIKQGTYVAPTTVWRFYVPGHTVTFMPVDYDPGDTYEDIAGRPVLRSDGSNGYWFSARLPSGHPGGNTNLRFYYLQVERYASGGLQFHGGVTTNSQGITVPATAGVNNNTVYGMLFTQLGSKHSAAGFGYGGLNTWNSSGNLIRNNHFVAHENTGGDAGLIHGIYLAHHSNGNTIASNRFSAVSGGPMRTRNDSNDNTIYGNTFTRTGTVGYSEWFCDTSCVAANPGHARECASHGNVFRDNDLVSGYSGGTLGTWALTPSGINYPGGAGCDNAGKPRLRTWGNT